MIRDSLKKPFEGIGDRLPDTWERAQVGIGTLIVFIAMVLVAAIAAGVLINTAGFLQSSAEQTGEESGAQVTNQLQVISTTGQVTTGASSAEETHLELKLDGDSSNTLTIVDSFTYTSSDYTAGGGTAPSNLELADGSDSITFTDGEDITFNVVNESVYEVEHDGNTLTVDTSSGEQLDTDTGTIAFDNAGSVETQSSTVTFGEAASALSLNSLRTVTSEVTLGDSTSNIEVLDGDTVTVQSQASTLTIQDDDGTDSIQVDADSEEFDLTIEVVDDDADVTNNNIRIIGPNGESFETDPTTSGGSAGLEFDSDVILSNGGTSVSFGGGNVISGSTAPSAEVSYVNADTAGTEPKVENIEIIVTQSPGASDIDMGQTTINFIAPDGSHDLTYTDSSTPTEDEEFALSAVQDDDGTMPVLSSGDRFTIEVDPGTLEAGSTAEMSITTPSGATKTVLLRIPDSLANQEAVSI